MRTASLLLLAAMSISGCYSYSVVPVADLDEGTRVRARVSPTEAARLGEVLGREARVLEGTVVAAEGDDLLLQVPSAVRTAGTNVQWLSQRVEIPRVSLVELEVRRLNPWRTAGAAAVVAAVVGYAAAEAFAGTGSPSGEGTKGGSDRFIGVTIRLPR